MTGKTALLRWRDRLIAWADLSGTAVFAVEGALAGMQNGLDVLVVGFATALGGGMIRDVLIGAVPPNAIRYPSYAVTALVAGALAFVFHGMVSTVPPLLLTALDAAGLSLFAVAGTQKALAFGIAPLLAALLGTITATGGGVIRDVLVMRVPVVLRADVYATAALVGSLVMIAARRLGLPPWAGALAGGAVCIGLRLVSVSRHWNLPTATID
jgi:uncharacterized membrane protein YeiH